MRTVTEWFGIGMATAAKRVIGFYVECLALLPLPGHSIAIRSDDLNGNWYISRYDVRTILAHNNFFLLSLFRHVRGSLIAAFGKWMVHLSVILCEGI